MCLVEEVHEVLVLRHDGVKIHVSCGQDPVDPPSSVLGAAYSDNRQGR